MTADPSRVVVGPAPRQRLRFGAVLGTMDDVDILPATLAHLRAIGVERIVVFDFGSTDGSLEVLAAAEAAGDVWLLHPTIEDDDDDWNRARIDIGRSLGVDRILYLDADEFILPAGGSLHDIEEIRDTDILSVPRFNVALGPDGPLAPPTMGAGEHAHILLHAAPIPDLYHHLLAHPDGRWLEGQLEPKVIVRPEAVARIHVGTHEVDTVPGQAWRRGVASRVVMAHLPFRSYEQFEHKAIKVSVAVAQDPEWFTDTQGWQWVRWSQLHAAGRTREEYERQMVQPADLPALRASGRIRSAAELLERAIPVHPTAEDMAFAATRSQPWIMAAGIACRREGIDIDSFATVIREGQHPTVRVPPGHIVKLFGPWQQGAIAMRSEVDALRLARRDPSLEVPPLVGHGMLDDAWGYVVQGQLAGESLSAASARLSPESWLEVATWVGGFIRRLHAVRVGPDDTARPVDWLAGYLQDRHARIGSLLADGGVLPPHLLAQLGDWMPSFRELMAPCGPPVLLHTDLHDQHVLGTVEGDRFLPTGVIDFSQMRMGPALYELGMIWRGLFPGDGRLVRAVVDAARLPGRDEAGFPRLALGWCLLHEGVAQLGLDEPWMADVRSLDELAERSFGEGRMTGMADTTGQAVDTMDVVRGRSGPPPDDAPRVGSRVARPLECGGGRADGDERMSAGRVATRTSSGSAGLMRRGRHDP